MDEESGKAWNEAFIYFSFLLCLFSLFFLAPPEMRPKSYFAVLLRDVGHGLSLLPAFVSHG